MFEARTGDSRSNKGGVVTESAISRLAYNYDVSQQCVGNVQQGTESNDYGFRVEAPVVHLLWRWPILNSSETAHIAVLVLLVIGESRQPPKPGVKVLDGLLYTYSPLTPMARMNGETPWRSSID